MLSIHDPQQARPMPKHPDPMFHTDADYPASVERSLAAGIADRDKAVQQVPELRRHLTRVPMPLLPTSAILDDRLRCYAALNPVILQFGLATVRHCLEMTCAANGIDLVDDLAQGEEQP
jgi:hypothetical protein